MKYSSHFICNNRMCVCVYVRSHKASKIIIKSEKLQAVLM